LIHPLNLNQLAYLPRFTSSCGSSGGGGGGGGGRNGNSGEVAVVEMISNGVQMMISTEQQLLVDNGRAQNDVNHPAYVVGSTARLLATTAPLELIRTRQISFTTTRQTRNGSRWYIYIILRGHTKYDGGIQTPHTNTGYFLLICRCGIHVMERCSLFILLAIL
jgi:hypothetical protein